MPRSPNDRRQSAARWPFTARRRLSLVPAAGEFGAPMPGTSRTGRHPLPVLDHLCPGCVLHPVADDTAAPHLLAGEFAVVDTRDRAPIDGALFVIEYAPDTPRARRAVVELIRRDHSGSGRSFDGWWSGEPGRPKSGDEIEGCLARGVVIAALDGPRTADAITAALRGRVIGVYDPAGAAARLAINTIPYGPATAGRAS